MEKGVKNYCTKQRGTSCTSLDFSIRSKGSSNNSSVLQTQLLFLESVSWKEGANHRGFFVDLTVVKKRGELLNTPFYSSSKAFLCSSKTSIGGLPLYGGKSEDQVVTFEFQENKWDVDF
ncbi:hypothetical protein E2320_013046 [Naja naja]|nr:hypothetical protein E2320_013046 [Naja naja]